MIINEGKNRQIEIDEKSPNPVGIEEENRSAGGAGYYAFAFLFQVLMAVGRPRFCLVLRSRDVGGQTIVGRDHRGLSYCRSKPSKLELSRVEQLKVRLSWDKLSRVMLSQVKLLRVKLLWVKPLRVKPLQVKQSRVKPSWVKPSEVQR